MILSAFRPRLYVNVVLTTIGLFSMLGNITFRPFVEELDDEDEICDTSSLVSNDARYGSSAKIPFPMESSILSKK